MKVWNGQVRRFVESEDLIAGVLSAAAEFNYGWPELPPLDKMHRDHPETGTPSLFVV